MFLRSWWSRTYNRPLKDPLLQDYTLEELYYEFRDHSERRDAAEEVAEEAADNIEQKKMDDALDWARAEEEREAQQSVSVNESMSQDDEAWMQNIISQAKAEYGEDFGSNLEVDFEN